jgi:hypothetical protein
MSRTILASMLMMIAFTSPTFAAEGEAMTPAAPAAALRNAPLGADVDWSLSPVRIDAGSRGAALPVLYSSLGVLNAFDAFSTTKALSSGTAAEGNPLLGNVAGNSAAMWALKGAATAGTIVAAERLWRTGHRGQAIALMFVSNGVMAAVAAQNASVLKR